VSKEQMRVLSEMKDVLRCRHSCHHSYQEVLQMIFSIRQHLYTQLCARHMQDCMQNILPGPKMLLANKTRLIPSQSRWRSSFP